MSELAAWALDDIEAQEQAQRGNFDGVCLPDNDGASDPSDAAHLLRAWNLVLRRRFAERLNAPEGCPDAIAVCTLHIRRCALQAVQHQLEEPTAALHSFVCPPWFDWWSAWSLALQEMRELDADARGESTPDLSWLTGQPVAAEKKRPGPAKARERITDAERQCIDAAVEAWRAFPERDDGDARHELNETIRAAAQIFGIPSTLKLARAVYAALGLEAP